MDSVQRLIALSCAAGMAAACAASPAVLQQLVEARRLASQMHVAFASAADASNRAVMADTDEASASAADEAKQARDAIEKDLDTLAAAYAEAGQFAEAAE